MFQNIDVFRMAHAAATHAANRQSVIARNMANADTPGYRAMDVAPFTVTGQKDAPGFTAHATRPTHMHGHFMGPSLGSGSDTTPARMRPDIRPDAAADPNGNSVTLEIEMVHAVNTKRQHDRALAIYRSSLNVLRSAIGRR